MSKMIEIEVSGPTGTGKSHVMAVIRAALLAEYGPRIQVASYDLAEESGLNGDDHSKWNKPRCKETVFVIRETNLA
ncbi:Uncharacterised protein [Pseudomonas fluorescens]|nr:Uncharacterised protein [Pseudomonas fluorescens]